MEDSFDIKTIIERNVKTNWKYVLTSPDMMDMIKKIDDFLNNEVKIYSPDLKIFPPKNIIFNAFNHFDIEKTKVCIIGMDPYHKISQATGLCFSVPKNIKTPPSLKNIYSALEKSIPGFKKPDHGDLSCWTKQNILMINSALTVRESCPGKHLKIWVPFTNFIIQYLSNNYKNIVFMLWGNHAKQKKNLINLNNNHLILEYSHPSPLSRINFSNCNHFTKTNEFLNRNNRSAIDWKII